MSTITGDELRAAVKEVCGYGNTVRPPVSATLLGATTGTVQEGPLAGAIISTWLYEGAASDGYKTDYLPVRRWWTVVTLRDPGHGRTVWSMGTRWANKNKAQADYEDSAASIRENR